MRAAIYTRVSTADQTCENQLIDLLLAAGQTRMKSEALITVLEDVQALGIAFVSLGEGIDATTAAGKLQMHIVGAFGEFERGRIIERVRAGIARARTQGKRLGRRPHQIENADLQRTAHLSQHQAAKELGIPRSVLQRARAARNRSGQAPTFARDSLAGRDVETLAR